MDQSNKPRVVRGRIPKSKGAERPTPVSMTEPPNSPPPDRIKSGMQQPQRVPSEPAPDADAKDVYEHTWNPVEGFKPGILQMTLGGDVSSLDPEAQQDSRITELENRVWKLEGHQSDHGFRIADHEKKLNGGGVSDLATKYPVRTATLVAGIVNALILVNPGTWETLPMPWPVVIPAILQAVAAVIGGLYTESRVR